MALDGIVIANMTAELRTRLTGGKIAKIAQPEPDELLFTIKNQKNTWKLMISASASLPLIYFTEQNKQSPMTAPNFCMLLRKHIGNGRIIDVTQPGLERIINIEIEHLDEMGDLCRKILIVELMGKHSNIIFCDSNFTVIDSIKHIPPQMSSVREVLPGRPYFIPDTMNKKNPLVISEEEFSQAVFSKTFACGKVLYSSLTGISPIAAEEICHLASIDSDRPANELNEPERIHLYHIFSGMMEEVKEEHFTPHILFEGKMPVEFSSLPLTCMEKYTRTDYTSISQVLETYFDSKNKLTRIRQKSADLRHIVQTALERNRKKYDLQLKQLKDTEKRDKFRVYGELINTYGYNLEPEAKKLTAFNYYTNEEITIPLDNTLSPQENAKKYFDRYNKLKRTFEAMTELVKETKEEIDYLESVSTALDLAVAEEDLTQIKEELREAGYVKKRNTKEKKARITSKPFHYISSDGFHIYVGKNNLQNEELTFRLANGSDWWFHAKGIPGSHVIIKAEGKALPDRAFEEAAMLAAYYSKGRENDKVEIDYIERKNIKKVAGAKPGFVIYHTNYSMVATPGLDGVTEAE